MPNRKMGKERPSNKREKTHSWAESRHQRRISKGKKKRAIGGKDEEGGLQRKKRISPSKKKKKLLKLNGGMPEKSTANSVRSGGNHDNCNAPRTWEERGGRKQGTVLEKNKGRQSDEKGGQFSRKGRIFSQGGGALKKKNLRRAAAKRRKKSLSKQKRPSAGKKRSKGPNGQTL